jgi:hypothetical protein
MTTRWLVLALMVCSMPAIADERPPTPYDQGRISVGLSLGTQRSFDHTYFSVGGRFGYYVLPGLELAVAGLKLFGGDPSIAMASPEARYVLYPVDWPARPFVGAFYRHWFIGTPYDDYDTLGGTLGVLWAQGSGLVLGIGVTVERVVSSCDSSNGDDCTLIYPALVVGLSL